MSYSGEKKIIMISLKNNLFRKKGYKGGIVISGVKYPLKDLARKKIEDCKIFSSTYRDGNSVSMKSFTIYMPVYFTIHVTDRECVVVRD